MNRNKIITGSLIVVALLLMVFVVSQCGSKEKKPPVDPCADKIAQISSLNQKNASLTDQVTDLKVENARLEEQIACLEKSKSKAPAKSTAVKTPVKKTVTVTQPVNEPTATVIKKAVTPGKANLDYLRQGGEIVFCARANGREDCYFPHYAMLQGVTFNRFSDNQVKGYNWKVEPTEFYDGDYGVTVEGTFYVSNNLIKKALQAGGLQQEGSLEIKCPYTGWNLKPMVLEDGFWLFRTQ